MHLIKFGISDISYLQSKEGGACLAPIIDLYDRKVIGWLFSNRMHATQTIVPAFKMAKINRPINNQQKLIFH